MPTDDAAPPAFIAAGDAHLSKQIWVSQTQIEGDAQQAFEQLVGLAVSWYVPLVLLGDIFDASDPPPEMIAVFRKQMDRCQEEGVPVYCLQGNHDRRSMAWFSALHDWPQWVGDGRKVDIGGLRVVGFDYHPRDELEERISDLAADCADVQVLLLHQAAKQALRFKNRWNFDLEWVPPNIKLVLLGDIHKAVEYRFGEDQLGAYTNATHVRDIEERGEKGCLLVRADLSFERLPLNTRPMEKFRVTAADQWEAVTDWLAGQLASGPVLPPLARVLHTSDFLSEVGRVAAELDGRAVVWPERIDDPRTMDICFDDDDGADEAETMIDQMALLGKLIDPDKEPAAYQLVLALLDEQTSVMETLRSRRQNFLEGD